MIGTQALYSVLLIVCPQGPPSEVSPLPGCSCRQWLVGQGLWGPAGPLALTLKVAVALVTASQPSFSLCACLLPSFLPPQRCPWLPAHRLSPLCLLSGERTLQQTSTCLWGLLCKQMRTEDHRTIYFVQIELWLSSCSLLPLLQTDPSDIPGVCFSALCLNVRQRNYSFPTLSVVKHFRELGQFYYWVEICVPVTFTPWAYFYSQLLRAFNPWKCCSCHPWDTWRKLPSHSLWVFSLILSRLLSHLLLVRCAFFLFFLALWRFHWQKLYLFEMYSIMVWYMCTLWNDDHNQVNEHVRHRTPLSTFFLVNT